MAQKERILGSIPLNPVIPPFQMKFIFYVIIHLKPLLYLHYQTTESSL